MFYFNTGLSEALTVLDTTPVEVLNPGLTYSSSICACLGWKHIFGIVYITDTAGGGTGQLTVRQGVIRTPIGGVAPTFQWKSVTALTDGFLTETGFGFEYIVYGTHCKIEIQNTCINAIQILAGIYLRGN